MQYRNKPRRFSDLLSVRFLTHRFATAWPCGFEMTINEGGRHSEHCYKTKLPTKEELKEKRSSCSSFLVLFISVRF